jgi:hypothetical protein
MQKKYEYSYEFMIHNCDKTTPEKYELYIHKYVSPYIQKLAETFLSNFQIHNLNIRYGITIEDIPNVFSLTASLFSVGNSENKIIGNLLFPNSDQHHEILDLQEPYHAKDISLQSVVSVEYYKKTYVHYQEMKFLHNELLFEHALFRNFFKVLKLMDDYDCLEYESDINNITIEVLHITKGTYWQVYKKEKGTGNTKGKLIYSFPKKIETENNIYDIITALRQIDYVLKKKWCSYELLDSDLESLIKMAKLQNY